MVRPTTGGAHLQRVFDLNTCEVSVRKGVLNSVVLSVSASSSSQAPIYRNIQVSLL